MTQAEVDALKAEGRCTHVAYVRGQGYFDGSQARVGFIQRAPTDADVNVALYENGRLKLLRAVHANEELFMRYGSGYVIATAITDEDRQRRREQADARERARERAELARIEREYAAGVGMYSELGSQRREARREMRGMRMDEH